jgi:hypothetical protein
MSYSFVHHNDFMNSVIIDTDDWKFEKLPVEGKERDVYNK